MAKSPRVSEVDWKAAGLRKTRQRETVLLLVCSHCDHPTADWIHKEARRKIPGISLATVYRTLRLLKEKGLLLEFSGSGYPSRYDVTPYDHEHIRCVACGSVTDVDLPEGGTFARSFPNAPTIESASIRSCFTGCAKNAKPPGSEWKARRRTGRAE